MWLFTSLSVALLVASMATYPGGNAVRPDDPGFDLWRNYFCDLIRPLGHDGRSNVVGMHLARAGMLAAAAALVPLWLVLPRLFPAARSARVCRWSGVLAAVALPGVPFTPSFVGPSHAVAIAATSLPGFVALAAGSLGVSSVRRSCPRLAALTAAVFVSCSITGALWLAIFVTTWPGRWALPTAQKVAWVLLVAWTLAAARAAVAPAQRGAA